MSQSTDLNLFVQPCSHFTRCYCSRTLYYPVKLSILKTNLFSLIFIPIIVFCIHVCLLCFPPLRRKPLSSKSTTSWLILANCLHHKLSLRRLLRENFRHRIRFMLGCCSFSVRRTEPGLQRGSPTAASSHVQRVISRARCPVHYFQFTPQRLGRFISCSSGALLQLHRSQGRTMRQGEIMTSEQVAAGEVRLLSAEARSGWKRKGSSEIKNPLVYLGSLGDAN